MRYKQWKWVKELNFWRMMTKDKGQRMISDQCTWVKDILQNIIQGFYSPGNTLGFPWQLLMWNRECLGNNVPAVATECMWKCHTSDRIERETKGMVRNIQRVNMKKWECVGRRIMWWNPSPEQCRKIWTMVSTLEKHRKWCGLQETWMGRLGQLEIMKELLKYHQIHL